MKKMYFLSAVFLGSSLLFATESMAWHFELGENGQASTEWVDIGQTLDFGRTVEANTGYDYTATYYESYAGEGGTTNYFFGFNGGAEDGMYAMAAMGGGSGGNYESATLDAQYRVVSDWGNNAQSPMDISSQTSFSAEGSGGESYSSVKMGILMENWYNEWGGGAGIENSASYSIQTDSYGGDNIDQGGGEEFSNDTIGESFDDSANAIPGIGYNLSASLEAGVQAQNWLIAEEEGIYDITDQDLMAAGFVDDQGNADPDLVIGQYISGGGHTRAELQFSMTTEEEDPGYVPPTVDLSGDPVGVDDITDPMMPSNPDSTDWTFDDFWVQEDDLYAFDPTYAIGYTYTLDPTSIINGFAFDELMLLLDSDLDNTFDVLWNGHTKSLTEGDGVGSNPFDFGGDVVTTFEVRGIEWDKMIDPSDPYGFPTMIGFNKPGQPVFKMTPINEYRSGGQEPVPEPATMLLFGTGLAGLLAFRKKTFFKK